MRLCVELDAPWQAAAPGDGEELAYERADLGLRLATTRCRHEEAAIGSANERSATGWPAQVTRSDDAVRVSYQLFEWRADVVVTGPAGELAARHEELVALARSAHIDGTAVVACLADLFSGLP